MSAAYYIVLERPWVDATMGGQSLLRHSEELDAAASRLGVQPLSGFISIDPSEASAFLASEGVEPGDVPLPELQFHSAADGLATIRALAADPAGSIEGVADDLAQCEAILEAAARLNVRWRFAVDF